jgi:hypothetical protein
MDSDAVDAGPSQVWLSVTGDQSLMGEPCFRKENEDVRANLSRVSRLV